MLCLRLWPWGGDRLLCRQKGEIVGGTDSNDKPYMSSRKTPTFVKFVISLRHNSFLEALGLHVTSDESDLTNFKPGYMY